jgi:FixJ family two-component response regulator
MVAETAAAPTVTSPVAGPDLVFVLDDDEAVCTALSMLIESAGYATRCFTSGASFLDAVRSAGGRCAVVDVAMPGIDGGGVLVALRSAGNALPVIFVTAHDRPAKHRHLVSNGGQVVLLKPVDPPALLAEIARAGSADAGGCREEGAGGAGDG